MTPPPDQHPPVPPGMEQPVQFEVPIVEQVHYKNMQWDVQRGPGVKALVGTGIGKQVVIAFGDDVAKLIGGKLIAPSVTMPNGSGPS